LSSRWWGPEEFACDIKVKTKEEKSWGETHGAGVLVIIARTWSRDEKKGGKLSLNSRGKSYPFPRPVAMATVPEEVEN
jgi:hypothetical protein